jgi:flagellar basal body-associated protein FliL
MKKLGGKKLVIVLVILIMGVGAAYSMAKPKLVTKERIQGAIYQLPKDFLLNLSDGHFAKLTLALVLAPGQSSGATAGSSSSSEGAGTLPEEAVIRDIVTNLITNDSSSDLVSDNGRLQAKHQILSAIRRQTDVKVDQVLFPDLTVQ